MPNPEGCRTDYLWHEILTMAENQAVLLHHYQRRKAAWRYVTP